MRSALGKGLDALISDDAFASVARQQPVEPTSLPIAKIRPNPKQPVGIFRTGFGGALGVVSKSAEFFSRF